MGTGKLRSAIRKSLSNHPQVKKYVSGKENEGGDGVTVISFQE
jgi:dsDNA-specific endonuclease/ATPase MutS2